MSGTEGELLILHASEEENKEDSVPVHAELSEQILAEKAQLISAGEERFESPGIDDEEESTSLLETQTRRQTGTTKFKKSGQLNIGAGGDPDDNPYDEEDFDGESGPRRAAGRGYSGSRLLQNISLIMMEDIFPSYPKGHYRPQIKSSACSTSIKRSSLIRTMERKVSLLEVVTRHPSWSIAKVFTRLIKRIDEVEERDRSGVRKACAREQGEYHVLEQSLLRGF